jgi:hypothetical protein
MDVVATYENYNQLLLSASDDVIRSLFHNGHMHSFIWLSLVNSVYISWPKCTER